MFSSVDWVDENGILHGAGNEQNQLFTQRVAGLTSNTTTHKLTVPTFNLTPTRNAFRGSSTRLSFWIMQVQGASATPIQMVPGTSNGLQVPTSIVSISACTPIGLCATFADLIIYNTPSPSLPADTYYTKDAVNALLGSLAGVPARGSAQYQVPVTGASPYTASYTLLSSLAGTGLSFTTGQFLVDTSIIATRAYADAGDAAVLATAAGLYAPLGRNLIAGAGLTGGGTLAADRTFTVGAGTGVTVNADDVAINQGFAPTWTGIHTWTPTTNVIPVVVNGTVNFSTGTPNDLAMVNLIGSASGGVTDLGYRQVGLRMILTNSGTNSTNATVGEAFSIRDLNTGGNEIAYGAGDLFSKFGANIYIFHGAMHDRDSDNTGTHISNLFGYLATIDRNIAATGVEQSSGYLAESKGAVAADHILGGWGGAGSFNYMIDQVRTPSGGVQIINTAIIRSANATPFWVFRNAAGSADVTGITSNSSNNIVIASAQPTQVGIGITPTAKLTVSDSGATIASLDTTGSVGSYLRFTSAGVAKAYVGWDMTLNGFIILDSTGSVGNFQVGNTGFLKAPFYAGTGTRAMFTDSAGVLGVTDTAWTAFTPTVTAGTGTFTSVSSVGSKYKKDGTKCSVYIVISITTNGTAANYIQATLPLTAIANNNSFYGSEVAISGKSLSVFSNGSTTALLARFSDGTTYPGVDNAVLIIEGTYEVAP